MASAAIRGAEGTLFINVDSKRFTLLVKDFSEEPDFDLQMNDYSGERTSRANPQFNGINLSFNTDEDDSQVIELRALLMAREEAGLAAPVASIKGKFKFRKLGVGSRILAWSDVTLAPGARGWGGRKDNIATSFKGFCSASARVLSQ
jgi:hypothetical protein